MKSLTRLIRMNGKIEILSFIGSICSIAALVITMSQNFAILNMLKIVIVVAVFVSVAGLMCKFANYILDKYLYLDYWASKILYWLFFSLIILAVSGGVAFLFSGIIDLFIEIGQYVICLIIRPYG